MMGRAGITSVSTTRTARTATRPAADVNAASITMFDVVHISADNPALDGQKQRFCCHGDSVYGPGRCTCWEMIYDLDQQPIKPDALTPMRSTMCGDCACRPESPERNGDPEFRHSGEGQLQAILDGSSPFFCHQGIRRLVGMRHPDGTVIDLESPGGYKPPMDGERPYRADGSPAAVCAGWAGYKLGQQLPR